MFLWWSNNGSIIFPTIMSRLTYFLENLGIESIYSQVVTTYPSVISPNWVPIVLGLRDVLIYAPAFIGLLFLWRFKSNTREKFVIIYSVFAFGFILVINVVFRIEPLRIVLFMAPFLTFLSSLVYIGFQGFSGIIKRIIVFVVFVLIISGSFVGFWGHSFAPIHLYDPSIDFVEIGESKPYFIRLKPFFENNYNISDFEVVRADVISRFVYLLDPEDYDKIKPLPVEDLDQLSSKKTLVCSFNELNLYQYFGYIWSPVEFSEVETIQSELQSYMNKNFNRLYSDGSISVWVS
jgi:hypothetical protein